MNDIDPYDLRAKYTHFSILVIGRANAGKTTPTSLLQRVCNTTEDPCIYDDEKNLVRIYRPEDEFYFWHFQLAWATSAVLHLLQISTSEPDITHQRGIHDINRPFAFKSSPGFIFHDSPGFETGDESNCRKYCHL